MTSVERQRILAVRLLPLTAAHWQIVRFDASIKAWVPRATPGYGDMFKADYDPQGIEANGYRAEHKTDPLDLGTI